MLYYWVKTLVGAALAANFSFPLITVMVNEHLWEEPMAVLAANMALVSTGMGLSIMLIGLYDVVRIQSVTLCRGMQYSGMGLGVAFKASQMCVAVDQYVAVMYPLQHYSIMVQSRPLLFAVTWLTCVVHIVIGFIAHLLDLETFAERSERLGSNTTYVGCRWESALSYYSSVFVEVEMVVFSLITASLLLHTGVVGHRIKARLMRETRDIRRNNTSSGEDRDSNKTFLDNYRAFKKILVVLSLTVSLDVVAPILRISSHWYPQPMVNGFLHQVRLLAFISEGWAYGLLNTKLRAAYRKMLCCKPSHINDLDNTISLGRQEVVPAVSVPEIPELQSVASVEAGHLQHM
ncbi:hypothetical protein FJT64_003725 [Amphibalanus amphitrite]|uniref:G-protein coupled receptors family 1 profile domain-containing protein n=1 Tax=Amphibalanus amphitrite TaxID=1232801 RepID=A0A6A4W5B7_AMPAM|nr:hypothetical protein FJT64_003725 [Amphibalanus amphitrite]